MDALQEVVERECVARGDDEFAVDDEARRAERAKVCDDFGKVPFERTAGFRLQPHVVAIAERKAAKAVPFRFVLPALAARNRGLRGAPPSARTRAVR